MLPHLICLIIVSSHKLSFSKMRTEGPPVSSELQLSYEDDHQNCSFDISVCGNLTEEYQAVSPLIREAPSFNFHFQIKNLSI